MLPDIRQEWEGDSDDGDLGPGASAETVSDQEEQRDQEERQPAQLQQRQRQRKRQQRDRPEHGEEAATLGGDQAASGVSLADSAFVAAEGAARAKAMSDPAEGSLDGTDGAHVTCHPYYPANDYVLLQDCYLDLFFSDKRASRTAGCTGDHRIYSMTVARCKSLPSLQVLSQWTHGKRSSRLLLMRITSVACGVRRTPPWSLRARHHPRPHRAQTRSRQRLSSAGAQGGSGVASYW